MNSLIKNESILLLLILLLALGLRLPGVFWGVHILSKPHFVEYHPDEPLYANMAKQMLNIPTYYAREDHIKGLSYQMAVLSFIFKPFWPIDSALLTMIGRSLNVICGVLTVACVYFLSKEIFKDVYIALFSCLLLALSGTHVTQSHQSVPDTVTIFWWYAAMYFSLIYSRYGKINNLVWACLSCGLALAVKLSFLSLVPIIYVLNQKKIKPAYWLLILGGIFIVFVAAQGGHYSLRNFILTLHNVRDDNINVINVHNNKWWNPVIYLAGMPPALGLANLILLITGIFFLRKKLTWKILRKDYFFIFILPLLLQIVVLCIMDITTSRHFLPIVPLLMMIAAYGLNELRKILAGRRFVLLLTAIILYQVIYVANVEYYFVFDPRDKAAQWITDNIPPGASIHFTRYADMFDFGKRYTVTQNYSSDYLVLHERYYLGYIRYKLCLLEHPFPVFDEMIHADRADYDNIQGIFKGKSDFKLIKFFPMNYITPENFLYKKLWGNYVSFIGDTAIYRNTKPH